ncbi:hypothetical protein MBM_03048 [Drepanopeziza brunnea f. sp. 'multigermtubi' MB_m1]|uniref:Uncharacterized protein n=1 Tax=Marssonina brunnea f. sp. multigermtubi (strain MB_m1) TaxID=1072389 RepID=K1X0T2_MARBU|nr:uncharacterized protein MBM_03048 [Drepanopeziza brunnea f. sp. 'multigermtubi' MB_m1]EKD18806.1 hypothetical protein MBM_03048 [Drepanopeziza brunnea f. sp. 'multigermtubi' MB_m1]
MPLSPGLTQHTYSRPPRPLSAVTITSSPPLLLSSYPRSTGNSTAKTIQRPATSAPAHSCISQRPQPPALQSQHPLQLRGADLARRRVPEGGGTTALLGSMYQYGPATETVVSEREIAKTERMEI